MLLTIPDNEKYNDCCLKCYYGDKWTLAELEKAENNGMPLGMSICPAFPDGIPNEIYWQGHSNPRPDLGQKNDIVFTPREEKEENNTDE